MHDATVMQAQAWYAQNQFQKALVFALTAVEQQPEDVAAQVLLGNIWLGLQNMDKATTAFNDAIHVDPMNLTQILVEVLLQSLTVTARINGQQRLK